MLTSIRRRVSVFACALATAALGVEFSLFGQNARATDDTLLSCLGTVSTQFSPGLTLIEQPTTFTTTGSFSPCLSVGNTINSGTFVASGQGTYSCLLNANQPFTVTYSWNDNKFSTVRYDAVINQRGAAVSVSTSNGIVISGEYPGARAVLTITTATLSALNCTTPGGVTNNVGTATLTLLSPL